MSSGLALHETGGSPSSQSPSGKSSVVRSRRLLVLALVLIGLVVYLTLPFLRAAAVLESAYANPAVAVYERFFSYQAKYTDNTLPGTDAPLQLRIYTPVGVKNPPPIVIVHGFAPDGNQNSYLNDIADRLASIGYLVALPTVTAETRFEMKPSDLAVVRDAIRYTAKTTHQRVALFGVSFGGGLVVPAAADPSVINDIKLIFVASGYNNLDTIGHYFLHDPVLDPSGKPYTGDPPPPFLIVSPYLKEILSPKDAAILGPVIARSLATNNAQAMPRDKSEKRVLDELEKVDTPETRSLYRSILARHREEIASISPAGFLPSLKLPIFVLHGSNDQVFPPGEVEWMRHETAGNPQAHILISPWVSHARVGQPANAVQKLEVLAFFSRMLRQTAHKEPILK